MVALGAARYPETREVFITADAGGSNSVRARAWKYSLQQLADKLGLSFRVSHFPPGTSKWNKIEHRLFSFISINWRGRPLRTHETIVNLIGKTTHRGGLVVRAQLDPGSYPTGVKISKRDMATLNIERDDFHGDWNYTLHPAPPATQATPAPAPPPHSNPRPGLDWLCPPRTDRDNPPGPRPP